MSPLAALSDEALIEELAKRRPDLVVVPRQASYIMALRGSQGTKVFEPKSDVDFVTDYLDLKDVGSVKGFRDGSQLYDVDERAWLVAAATWRGCIGGFEEWERYRKKEGETPFVLGWLKPCVLEEASAEPARDRT